jgi:hypothetical protein
MVEARTQRGITFFAPHRGRQRPEHALLAQLAVSEFGSALGGFGAIPSVRLALANYPASLSSSGGGLTVRRGMGR